MPCSTWEKTSECERASFIHMESTVVSSERPKHNFNWSIIQPKLVLLALQKLFSFGLSVFQYCVLVRKHPKMYKRQKYRKRNITRSNAGCKRWIRWWWSERMGERAADGWSRALRCEMREDKEGGVNKSLSRPRWQSYSATSHVAGCFKALWDGLGVSQMYLFLYCKINDCVTSFGHSTVIFFRTRFRPNRVAADMREMENLMFGDLWKFLDKFVSIFEEFGEFCSLRED